MADGEMRFREAWYLEADVGEVGPATLSLEDDGEQIIVHWQVEEGFLSVPLDELRQALGTLRLGLED